MRLWPTVSLLLVLLLVGSNIWWLYRELDDITTSKYQGQMLYERSESLKSLQAIIPDLASGKSKEEIVELIEEVLKEEGYEKEGATWIGWLGLTFDDDGQLVKVMPTWSPYEEFAQATPPGESMSGQMVETVLDKLGRDYTEVVFIDEPPGKLSAIRLKYSDETQVHIFLQKKTHTKINLKRDWTLEELGKEIVSEVDIERIGR
ncbi:MAG: hypothetical protein AB8G77_04585 [Rhodothermales bacterium]